MSFNKMPSTGSSVSEEYDCPQTILCHNYTTQVEKKYTFKWTIDNFSCKPFENRKLPTTFFNIGVKLPEQIVTLAITGSCNNRECCIQIPYDFLESLKVAWVWVEKEGKDNAIVFHALKGRNYFVKSLQDLATSGKTSKCLLCSGNCTIICEITLFDYVHRNIKSFYEEQTNSSPDAELFKNKKYCDITFVVSGQELLAHKCILTSRNKVFAAMFEHKMEETKTSQVTIEDIGLEVFEDMLRFIYTGEVLHLEKFAAELLGASEKYDVNGLKVMCIEHIARNIAVENAAELLIMADLYGSAELRDIAIQFIDCNRVAVARTDGWEKLTTNHAQLLAALYLDGYK